MPELSVQGFAGIARETRELTRSVGQSLEQIMLNGLPDEFDVRKIRCMESHNSGVRIYSYDGEPFLELHPMEFREEHGEKSFKIIVTHHYRYLKDRASSDR